MPTGYTADVMDGKVTDVKDFAAACARGFGAFIHQRDDGSDAVLTYPTRNYFYDDQLAAALRSRDEWKEMTEEDKYAAWSKYHTEQTVALHKAKAENAIKRARYEGMLAQVQSVEVPAELDNFKNFMVSQLTESIDFDCGSDDKFERDYYKVLDYVSWCNERERRDDWDVEYYTRNRREDEERYSERVKYINLMADTFGFEVKGKK